MKELLEFFRWNEVPIQITIDINNKPTVHAISGGEIHETEHENVEDALELMKVKLSRKSAN